MSPVKMLETIFRDFGRVKAIYVFILKDVRFQIELSSYRHSGFRVYKKKACKPPHH